MWHFQNGPLLVILETKEEQRESRTSVALVTGEAMLPNAGQCCEVCASQDTRSTHTVQIGLDFLRSLEQAMC